jgi:predicted phosphoribosyltransferase
VVERLARALEREAVADAVVIAVPRSIALAQRVSAALELPLEVAPVVTVGASRPGVETAAVTPDGHVYVWDSTGVDGERLEAAAFRAVDHARALEACVRRRSGTEGTWLLVARGANGPAETVAALRWLRRKGNGRFVVAAAEWDEASASAATAWADRVIGAASGAARPRLRRPRPLRSR